MKIKITINRPRTLIEGWTGFVTLPSGRRIVVNDLCGGAPVAFNTREALVAACKRTAQANFEAATS